MCLVPKLKFTTVCLVSELADFVIGGVFSGPKISQFRELTVCTVIDTHLITVNTIDCLKVGERIQETTWI